MIRWDRVWAVIVKDFKETTATSQVIAPVVIVPMFMIVAYPVGFLLLMRSGGTVINEFSELVEKIPAGVAGEVAGMTFTQAATYMGVVYLFAGFFLIVPTMVATILSASSFAGEKERRTLEGLLYTPLTDAELVVGKIGAGLLPAVAFSWITFAVYTLVVDILGAPIMGYIFFPTPNWWVMLILLVPALSLLVVSLVVLVSTKVKGFQEANSIAGLVVLPLVAVVAGQAMGLMVLSTSVLAIASGVLGVADVVLLYVIVRGFKRARVVSYL